MAVSTALKVITPSLPVAGSAYRFTKTYVKIYNAASPPKALVAEIKRIKVEYTPPVIKYPLLWVEVIACGRSACVIGDPNFAVGAFKYCIVTVTKNRLIFNLFFVYFSFKLFYI